MGGLSFSDAPLVAWYIGVLVFLEGLLSADNALVLAIMVRHLPKNERRRVLRYGMWAAVGFRFVAVLMSSLLLKFWIFKVLGGLYLLYLAVSHFLWSKDEVSQHDAVERQAEALETGAAASGFWKDSAPLPLQKRSLESGAPARGFWKIVTSVTMADIAFSIDSILAAVAMGNSFPSRFGPNWQLFIVYIGGVLGIITMRFVVGYFVILLERFPGLAEGAYVLVAWIGVKLLGSGIHDALLANEIDENLLRWFHIPEWLFWAVMVLIAVISFLVKPKSGPPQDREVKESLEFFDPGADGAGNLDDGSRSALEVDEAVPPGQIRAQRNDEDHHFGHDGSAAPHGDGSLDPQRGASTDKLGDSRR